MEEEREAVLTLLRAEQASEDAARQQCLDDMDYAGAHAAFERSILLGHLIALIMHGGHRHP